MNTVNLDLAWEILVARKAKRTENRTAFLAALIMERCKAHPSRSDADSIQTPNPSMAEAFAVEFARLARSIKALAEADCNYGLSPLQETRSANLQRRFGELANALGFNARTGGDPRGACAYLINPDDPKEGDGWGDGWAVYS
jgi:hypothetical protein